MSIERETALYGPVKQFLARQGYQVKAEVRGCDLAAVRGDDLVVVELKPAVNLTLVLQGVDRQRLTDLVYLAVEEPQHTSRRRWSAVQGLCRRLGLGLLTVRFGRGEPAVTVVCDPGPYQPRRSARKRGLLLGEFQRRSADYNTGGSTRKPVVTAYREEALRLAAALHRNGPCRVKELRATTGCQKAGDILGDNYYGWFAREERGVYRLTERGEKALRDYAEVIGPIF